MEGGVSTPPMGFSALDGLAAVLATPITTRDTGSPIASFLARFGSFSTMLPSEELI